MSLSRLATRLVPLVVAAALLPGCYDVASEALAQEEESAETSYPVVTRKPVLPVELTFSVDRKNVNAGETVRFTWESENADRCGGWTRNQSTSIWGSTNFPKSGSRAVTVPATGGDYTYYFTCSNKKGSITLEKRIHVAGPPALSIVARPSSNEVGEQTTVFWSSSQGASCTASGDFTDVPPPSGEAPLTLTRAGLHDYTLTCERDGYSLTRRAVALGLPARLVMKADATEAAQGGTIKLTWTSAHATGCTASGAWSGPRATSGTEDVLVPAAGINTYTLTCQGAGSYETQSVQVNGGAYRVQLNADATTLRVGRTVTLSWSSNSAGTCTASGDWSGARGASGSETILMSATGDFSYSLECDNGSMLASAQTDVSVIDAPDLPDATAYQIDGGHSGSIEFPGGITSRPARAWQINFGRPVGYPLVVDGRVFVAVQRAYALGGTNLYALDASDGSTLWGPVAYEGTGYQWTTLAYEDGKVIALNYNGSINAYAANDGTLLWSNTLPGGAFAQVAPTAAGGRIYTAANGNLVALDATDGSLTWTQPFAFTANSMPSIVGDLVVASRRCLIRGFDSTSGDMRWEQEKSGTTACAGYLGGATAPIRHDLVFGWPLAARDSTYLPVIDATNGIFLPTSLTESMPAIANGVVVGVTGDSLTAYPATGQNLLWSFGHGDIALPPIVVNETVFAVNTLGVVYAIDLYSGLTRWQDSLGISVAIPDYTSTNTAPPALAAGDGLLVVPTGNVLTAWFLTP